MGEIERLEDDQKALERKAVRRIQKGNLQAMHKMFRVLMVQSLLEEATASAAQGLEPPGTELPTCGNDQKPEALNKPFWTILLMFFITVVAIGVLHTRRIYRRRRENQEASQRRLDRLETGVALMQERA